MRAIGYTRVSTIEQAIEGVSLDNQKSKIKAYAEMKDFELVDIIEDAGISAKNLNRPGIQKILKQSKSGYIDAVIVYKLDRIFRNTIDALETTRYFEKCGVSFHSIQETLDTKSAMGKFFFTIMAGIAEMERGIIGERTKQALKYKKTNGEKTGGHIPFGYDVNKYGKLVVNAPERAVIAYMESLKAKGHSYRYIARELKNKGYKTKRGLLNWNHRTVSNILKRTA